MKRYQSKQMRLLYERWKESAESMTKFARGEEVPPPTFYYWVNKFEKETTKPNATAGNTSFRSIVLDEVVFTNPSEAVAIIRYPSGVSIELHGSVKVNLLKSLVE